MSIIAEPNQFDILCGQDKTYLNHTGNLIFRQLLESYVDTYTAKTTTKQDKMKITKQIVQHMKDTYSSRFIKRVSNSSSSGWQEITEKLSRDKISHALRFAAAHNEVKKARLLGGGDHQEKKRRGRKSKKILASVSCDTATPVRKPRGKELRLLRRQKQQKQHHRRYDSQDSATSIESCFSQATAATSYSTATSGTNNTEQSEAVVPDAMVSFPMNVQRGEEGHPLLSSSPTPSFPTKTQGIQYGNEAAVPDLIGSSLSTIEGPTESTTYSFDHNNDDYEEFLLMFDDATALNPQSNETIGCDRSKEEAEQQQQQEQQTPQDEEEHRDGRLSPASSMILSCNSVQSADVDDLLDDPLVDFGSEGEEGKKYGSTTR